MADAFGTLRDVVDGRARQVMAMPGMSERWLKVAGAILLCALTAREVPAAAMRETPGDGAAPGAAVAVPQPTSVFLEPTPGFDDDAAYLRSVAERVESLLAAAGQTEEPARQVAFSLAAANLILAEQLEPFCSRKLLRLEPGEPDRDGPDPRTMLARSDKLIERAFQLLDGLRGTPDPPTGSWNEVRRRAQALSAFSGTLRAFTAADDAAGKRATREAASRLSPFLEDLHPGVAAAASFWQACLRSLGTNTDAVLSMLDLTLADPSPTSMPYAFFARLLRSRVIAGRGGPQSALALLLQMEERCQDWFTDDQERDLAIRTIQLTRLQIVSDWHDRLAGPDQDAARTWCVDRAKGLIAQRFGEDRNFVWRLAPLIPIVAAPPAPQSGSADTPPEEP